MSRAVKLQQEENQFVLPPKVIGRADLNHLIMEIEKVDYELGAQAVRSPDQPLVLPSLTRTLTDLLTSNNLSVESPDHRQSLLAELRKAKDHAPVVQITFAVDPEPDALGELLAWIRENLHPSALITVGMQPSIIGGCIVRTPDHIYDFSMRKR